VVNAELDANGGIPLVPKVSEALWERGSDLKLRFLIHDDGTRKV
jgi:hypothetical protein